MYLAQHSKLQLLAFVPVQLACMTRQMRLSSGLKIGCGCTGADRLHIYVHLLVTCTAVRGKGSVIFQELGICPLNYVPGIFNSRMHQP